MPVHVKNEPYDVYEDIHRASYAVLFGLNLLKLNLQSSFGLNLQPHRDLALKKIQGLQEKTNIGAERKHTTCTQRKEIQMKI